MFITLNGENKQIPEDTTAADLVKLLNLAETRLAMEVNEEIVSRSLFGETRLKPGDSIEIVHAIGGG